MPGPPRNFKIWNVTNRSVKLSWEAPESFVEILRYLIKPVIIHTYSSYAPDSPEYIYGNNTFQAEIITLRPATKYNMTLTTRSSDGEGAVVFQIIETLLGG